jgi:hypothetical protein
VGNRGKLVKAWQTPSCVLLETIPIHSSRAIGFGYAKGCRCLHLHSKLHTQCSCRHNNKEPLHGAFALVDRGREQHNQLLVLQPDFCQS